MNLGPLGDSALLGWMQLRAFLGIFGPGALSLLPRILLRKTWVDSRGSGGSPRPKLLQSAFRSVDYVMMSGVSVCLLLLVPVDSYPCLEIAPSGPS